MAPVTTSARMPGLKAWMRLSASTPPEPRHHQVEHDGVGPVALDAQQGLEPIRRLEDVEAGVPKGLDEHLPDIRVVVRNQHPHEFPSLCLPARTATRRRSRPAPTLRSRTRPGR